MMRFPPPPYLLSFSFPTSNLSDSANNLVWLRIAQNSTSQLWYPDRRHSTHSRRERRVSEWECQMMPVTCPLPFLDNTWTIHVPLWKMLCVTMSPHPRSPQEPRPIRITLLLQIYLLFVAKIKFIFFSICVTFSKISVMLGVRLGFDKWKLLLMARVMIISLGKYKFSQCI